ncbi:putative lipid transporter atnI [Hyphodiscus hymeniophilus]|uniref:Lipid transporter atnI n=1 Tax=Hyphodiscus hymeniophilus TaxID=353542 RepID=A0A9P6SKS8_9HELO|nr:putative lipid transporter atnI [Hyphodiscus hymeniophilus]
MSSTVSSTTLTAVASATGSCINVTPGKDGYVPEWACNSNYNYNPSMAAALVFAIIFGITTFVHIYQAIAYKKIRLCWVIIMGASWEFASFALRVAGTKNQQSTPIAFVSQILVLLAPMWVNAFDYMVLGRMIYFFVPEQKIWGIKGIQIAKIFVWLDIVSFITQVAGGIMISPGSTGSTVMTGIHIYMGGIGLQELCILIFTSIAIKFSLGMRQRERELATSRHQILDGKPDNWRMLLYVLYASLTLITIRIIFRLVEFASGLDPSKNPIPYHEAYFMALDALPMFVAIVLMNVVHPGRILQGEGSEFPRMTRKERKEAKRIRREEKALAKEEKKASKEEKKMKRKMGSLDNV